MIYCVNKLNSTVNSVGAEEGGPPSSAVTAQLYTLGSGENFLELDILKGYVFSFGFIHILNGGELFLAQVVHLPGGILASKKPFFACFGQIKNSKIGQKILFLVAKSKL